MATGSEVFLLDMGDPVRIQDLARRLIRLAGLSPERDIKIEFTGRRPGEKLEEVLSSEPLESTSNDKVNEVKLNHPRASYLMKMVSTLESAAVAGDQAAVRALLNDLVGGGLETDDAVVDISRPTEAVGWS
jgi:O-antigen biosynthesis protein WbqV